LLIVAGTSAVSSTAGAAALVNVVECLKLLTSSFREPQIKQFFEVSVLLYLDDSRDRHQNPRSIPVTNVALGGLRALGLSAITKEPLFFSRGKQPGIRELNQSLPRMAASLEQAAGLP
jgi:hypothetical protein